jgi:hypothetical protein
VWIAASWRREWLPDEEGVRLTATVMDRFCDRMPQVVWPKMRYVFYALAGLEMSALLLATIGALT